jgi:prephenate dehydrogenase
MRFERVAIIGLGLIGSSLGLALGRWRPALEIVGFDADRDTARRAEGLGAVRRTASDAVVAATGADLVILATPVRAAIGLLEQLGPHLSPDCVVTDTGSTKARIVAAAAQPGLRANFVGGHPMTGRLTQGTAEPVATLFDGAVYCLTPAADTDPEALAGVAELVEALGAQPRFFDPAEHDGLVAAISHVPYLLATTLMAVASDSAAWREMGGLAAGGFATMTRLANGDPAMYGDICLTNRVAIVEHLDRFMEGLAALRESIAEEDAGLTAHFEDVRRRHADWLKERKDPAPTMSMDELRPTSLILPRRWQDALRGLRPPERH